MIFLAAAAIAALVLTVLLGAGLLRSQQRAAARERDLLVNQLLHLADKTWQSPPSWTPTAGVTTEPDGEAWPVWAGAAEQDAVY